MFDRFMRRQKVALAGLAGFILLGASARPDETTGAAIDRETKYLHSQLIETRRDIHRHPELSNREARTGRLVAERLRKIGLDEIRTNVAHHGVVALLIGSHPGAVVALRADMDALPIDESLAVSK
jgi:amidohydrolase